MEDRSEEYRKEFAEMPLEKKIANLVQLETIALGETVSFIINSPFKIADKVLDVMAEFGFKKEEKDLLFLGELLFFLSHTSRSSNFITRLFFSLLK